MPLPQQEEDCGHAGADEQADDDGVTPSVVGGAELQCDEEHDSSGCEEGEAGDIEGGEDAPDKGEGKGWLGGVFGDGDGEEEETADGADGEVDVKA
jgi:hypothetical protein